MVPQGAIAYLIAATIVLPIFAILAIILRVCARRVNAQPLRGDDYAIFLALVFTIALSAQGIYNVYSGLEGVSLRSMSPATFSRYQMSLLATLLLSQIVFGAVKVSVILFYKRIFETARFRIFANIALVLTCCWSTVAFFGFLFSAKGVSSFWSTPAARGGTQYNFNFKAYLTTMNSLDMAFDIGILCLPIPMVLALQMDFKRKMIIISLFMLGLFCVISSALKVHYGVVLQRVAKNPDHIDNDDKLTSTSTTEDLWARVECSTSIIAACLPTLRPLLHAKSIDSIVNSIRSALSLHSITILRRKNTSKSQVTPLTNSEDAQRSWHELGDINTRSARSGQIVGDLE